MPADPASDAGGTADIRHPLVKRFRSKAESYHQSIPYLRLLPGPAVAIVVLLATVNAVIWVAIAIVLRYHAALAATAILAWTLGLRHALDADHISAIDLMTRRLVASGQRPVTVGTFFSLGHSTIVIITCLVVAASSAAIQSRFGSFSGIGGIIGSSVSAAFLIILGIINIYILYKLVDELRKAIAAPIGQEARDFTISGGGCLFHLLKKMFKLVDKPWKMYPVGVMFGLGFDTSSEIALLGISSIQAAKGTSIWLILIYPILFTAGMCLLDTFDGAAMMSLYTSARLAKDIIAVLYYQIVLTAITVVVALIIGIIQILSLVVNVKPDLSGPFWDGVIVAGDNYDVIGGGICGSFVVFGGLSVLLYKPWRRRIDCHRQRNEPYNDDEGDGAQDALHGLPQLQGEDAILPSEERLDDGDAWSQTKGRDGPDTTKSTTVVELSDA